MSIRVTARLLPTKKTTKIIELEDGSTVAELLRALKLYPDAWIAVRGDLPLPLDEKLSNGDDVKLISVVSGG